MMPPEFLLNLVMACAVGAGVYAAIRADLATLHERTKNHADAIRELKEKLK